MTSTRSRIYAFTGQKMVQVPPDELQPDRIDETARRLKCTLRGPHSLLHEATDPGAPGGDGRDGVAMLLVDRGADPRIRDLNGATPLMNAARRNSARVVRRLLDAGAEPSVKDRCDRTAGDHARSDEIRNLLGTRPAN
ncbi:MAG: ankyrin repeat domain-containing protein [Burkholderiales bacterium]|nr:ankyrin repeat domain-containing protein [Burkholderiales bacterium]